MPASVIKADYEQLQQIATQFGQESDQMRQLITTIQGQLETLRGGDWEGRGAELFYGEMDNEVLPSLVRLSLAFNNANQTTLRISIQMQQAEADAAKLLLMKGGNGRSSRQSAINGGDSNGDRGRRDFVARPVLGGDSDQNDVIEKPVNGNGKATENWTGNPYVDAVINEIIDTFKLKGSTDSKKNKLGIDLGSGELAKYDLPYGLGDIKLGSYSAGIGLQKKEGKWMLGLAGDITAAKGKSEGTIVGDSDLGVTQGLEIKVLQGSGLFGYKDGSIGADVGLNLASIKLEQGFNLAGWNVSMNAETGIKWEFGAEVGKNSRVKVGPFTIGFSIGDAK